MIIPFVAIFCLVVFGIGVGQSAYHNRDWVIGLSLFIAGIVVVGSIFLNISVQIETEERINLYSSHNSNEIFGNWSILGGQIEEKDVVYYWVDDDGVLSKHYELMNKSTFIEDGGEYLLLIKREPPENLKWLFVPDGLQKAEFHVPEGSVARMYSFN